MEADRDDNIATMLNRRHVTNDFRVFALNLGSPYVAKRRQRPENMTPQPITPGTPAKSKRSLTAVISSRRVERYSIESTMCLRRRSSAISKGAAVPCHSSPSVGSGHRAQAVTSPRKTLTMWWARHRGRWSYSMGRSWATRAASIGERRTKVPCSQCERPPRRRAPTDPVPVQDRSIGGMTLSRPNGLSQARI